MTESDSTPNAGTGPVTDHDTTPEVAWARPPAPSHTPLAYTYRPGQGEAVREVLERFRDGARVVFLDAPVGSGKSLIHLEVARELGGAYVSTPQVPLVGQYKADTNSGGKFAGLGTTLTGRRNYPCEYDRTGGLPDATAEGAPCTLSREFLCPVRAEGRCDYWTDLEAARAGPTAVTTLAYLLTGIRRSIKWPPRPLLVVDEAHGLVNGLVDHYAISLGKRTLPGFAFDRLTTAPDRLAFLREELPAYKTSVDAELRSMIEDGADSTERRRQSSVCERVTAMLTSLAFPAEWVYSWDATHDAHTWRPLDIAPFVGGFWEQFQHILLSSGTFADIPRLAAELGVPRPVGIVRVADTFPAERAPIVAVGTARLSKRSMAESLPSVVAALARVAAAHPGERGFIHAHSYVLATSLLESAPPELRARLVVHGRNDRNVAYAVWVAHGRPASVFLGIGMNEGVDLAMDVARWQVVVKCPFPDLGDPWVRGRLERPGGRSWYEGEALTAILQACGRVMRAVDDTGTTYILDRHAVILVRRHLRDVPEWFRRRLAVGAVPP